jgi:hypothetical protein
LDTDDSEEEVVKTPASTPPSEKSMVRPVYLLLRVLIVGLPWITVGTTSTGEMVIGKTTILFVESSDE